MHDFDLPLSRTVTDRAADRRGDPTLLDGLIALPSTRVLLVSGGQVVVRSGGHGPEIAWYDPPAAALRAPSGSLAERWAFLGYDDADLLPGVAPGEDPSCGPAYLAHQVPMQQSAVLCDGDSWQSLRVIGAELSPRDAGLATEAVALFEWHDHFPACPRCGSRTVPVQAGWVRRCTVDGTEHYPRTDPAVIMAVVDEQDRLLLANSTSWPARRYSTLAGFVEPGESLEHAVRREVREETSVVVDEVVYQASQPWPFPASLMLGFRARAVTTEIAVDGTEIANARWITRAQLRADVICGDVVLPPTSSIARSLIQDWFGAKLPPGPDAAAWSRTVSPSEPSSNTGPVGHADDGGA